MIIIALGANLPTERFGPPRQTLEKAYEVLAERGIRALSRSPWYETEPVPPSGQPWYVNGVAIVESDHGPAETLAILHEIEAEFGRARRERDEARVLDLDLIAYNDEIIKDPNGLTVPHPRMHLRRFVLVPLVDVAPDWQHPELKETAKSLLEGLPPGEAIRPLSDPAPLA